MAEHPVRTVTRFDLPRTPGVPVPSGAQIVANPISVVDLYWFAPANVFKQRSGELTLWRDQLPPFNGYSGTSKGRLAAFFDGLMFLPDRLAAKLVDFALIDAIQILPAAVEQFKSSILVTSADIDVLFDTLGEIADEIVEKAAKARDETGPYAKLAQTLTTELARDGAAVFPFVDLVEISMEAAPSPAILPRALGVQVSYLVLKFVGPSGRQTTLAVSTEGGSTDLIPYFPIARSNSRHKDKQLAEKETHDRIALEFARARANAELYAFANQVPGARKVPTPGGLAEVAIPDPRIAREVLDRMGRTASLISALPFAHYGMVDPLAGLRMLAARA